MVKKEIQSLHSKNKSPGWLPLNLLGGKSWDLCQKSSFVKEKDFKLYLKKKKKRKIRLLIHKAIVYNI